MLKFEDKVRGVLFGTAFGDAIGATVEKLTYDEIKENYGHVETILMAWHKADWDPFLRKHRRRGFGIITDDTLMTIALMNIYNNEKRSLDAWDMADGMVKEIAFNKVYIPEFDREDYIIERLFYPEKWIYQRHNLAKCEPREGGIGNMINCGAAMYIAPIGIMNACDPKAAYDEAIAFASGHQASYGLEAAGVLAGCVAKAFEPGVTIEDVVETALELAKDGTKEAIEAMCSRAREMKDRKNDWEYIVREFQKVILPYSPVADDMNLRTGLNYYVPSRIFSIEELPFALAYAILHEGDFRKSIIDGINSGRDTDSIGVMAGVILGAMYGDKHITKEEKNTLMTINRIDIPTISEKFAKTAKDHIEKRFISEEKRKKQLKEMF